MKRLVLFAAASATVWGCGPVPPGGGGGGGSGGQTDNLISNAGFEAAALDNWFARDGSAELIADAHTGRQAVRLTAPNTSSAIATLAYQKDVATDLGTNTYCGLVWVKGTCDVLLYLSTVSAGFKKDYTQGAPVGSGWGRVPEARVLSVPGAQADRLVLMVQTKNAVPGDTLDIDDVDVWLSPDGSCGETR